MAVSFQSPGINVNEYEIKNTILAPTSTSAAFAGVFKWGPADKIVKVISEADLVNTFGKPINDQVLWGSNAVSIAESFFSAANFLAYSSNLNIVRAVAVPSTVTSNSQISYNASTRGNVSQTANNNYTSCIQVLNEEQWITDFDGLNIHNKDNSNPYFIARYPGDLGNSLAVYVCSSINGWNQSCHIRINTDIANKTTNFTAQFLGDNSSIHAANTSFKGTTKSPSKWNDFTTGDYILIKPDKKTKVPNILCTIADYSTTGSNTITLKPINKVPASYTSSNNVVGANTNIPAIIYWQFKNNFSNAPTTSAYCAAAGTTNDELNILVVDKLGKITGIPGQVLEKYENVSKCVDAKTDTGLSNYYVQRIFEDSKYIYVGRHLLDNNSDTPQNNTDGAWGQVSAPGLVFNKTDNYPAKPGNYAGPVVTNYPTFNTGSDGTFTPNLDEIKYAFSFFEDKSKIDIDLIFSGPFGRDVKEYVCKIASDRKDCVAFISPDRATVIPSALAGDTHIVNSTDVTIEVTGTTDSIYSDSTYSNDNQGALNNLSSYCVMDSGWKFQYDKYNNNHKWMPLNADIAGLCAQTDINYGSFWSPAGFSRGMIKNSLRLAWNPNQSDRDDLYSNGINPVCTFNEGTILYGDKTLSPYVSSFDRINVRRLFLTLEKTISKASKSSLFEFNDQFTRAQFIALVDPFLRGIKAQRGIYDYRIVCDESNNTANVIDQNQFIGDIYIKPSRTINFIQLNFVAVPTGVDFSTIVGNF